MPYRLLASRFGLSLTGVQEATCHRKGTSDARTETGVCLQTDGRDAGGEQYTWDVNLPLTCTETQHGLALYAASTLASPVNPVREIQAREVCERNEDHINMRGDRTSARILALQAALTPRSGTLKP